MFSLPICTRKNNMLKVCGCNTRIQKLRRTFKTITGYSGACLTSNVGQTLV